MTGVDRAPAVVDAPAGSVRGGFVDGAREFRGIPFAEPPVGELRFRPPVAAARWEGVRDALEDGPICPQRHDVLDANMGIPRLPESEAGCLTLNVWTPEAGGSGLPVMVWIHGGSFETGACSWPPYDLRAFGRDGVVAVGMNYRLNAFGFLNLSGLFEGAEDSVNLGVQDVVLALRWIRENVAAFGGDPDNVTIFGESAGAGMVGTLLATPSARGLFQRAILMSGTAHGLPSAESSRVLTRNFLRLAGVAEGDWEALSALPEQRVADIAADFAGILEGLGDRFTPWYPCVDERIVPQNGHEAIAEGDTAGIDLMLGWTAEEYRLVLLADEEEGGPTFTLDERQSEVVRAAYREAGRGDDAEAIDLAITEDQAFFIPAVSALELHLAAGGRGYMYHFTWGSPVPTRGGPLGSCHALELPFVFDRWIVPEFHGDVAPEGLIEWMHHSWIAFAATGDPSVEALPAWPAYDVETRPVMRFDARCELLHDPYARVREAWRTFGPIPPAMA